MFYFSTEHLRKVFDTEDKISSFKNLIFDLNRGNEILDFDEETGVQRKVSCAEANAKARKIIFKIFELDEESAKSKKKRHRAIKNHWEEFFEVIEEEIDFKVVEGYENMEWFNQLVEMRNLKLGDDEEFWTDEKAYLTVGEVARGQHDLTLQTLGGGSSFRVKTSIYAAKVGYDIDLIILGKIDFSKLTDKIAEAFLNQIQEMMYEEVKHAKDKLPAQFRKSGTLSAVTKQELDNLITDVSVINGCDVVIMGTKNALQKLNKLHDVEWASNELKYQINSVGRLGDYYSTELIEIPQRIKRGDITSKLFDDNELYIFAKTTDKFVKFVDIGETETFEVTEKGTLRDDFQTYEVRREMGVATVLGQYFGTWTLV